MISQSPTYLHVKVTINGNELNTFGFDDEEITIGRGEECHVVLDNAGVSRSHAKLVRDDNLITVYDLYSGNGTFVNGKQIMQAELNAGDTLRIGKFTLYVSCSKTPLAAAPRSVAKAAGVNSNTVFLRPEERVKILQQSKTHTAPAQANNPSEPAAQKSISAMVFFALGTAFGIFCCWLFGG